MEKRKSTKTRKPAQEKITVTFKPTTSQEFVAGKILNLPQHPVYGDGSSEIAKWPCGCTGTRMFNGPDKNVSFTHCRTHAGRPQGLPECTFTSHTAPVIRNPQLMFMKGGLVYYGKKRFIPFETERDIVEEFTLECGCRGGREFSNVAEGRTTPKSFFDPCAKHEKGGAPYGNTVTLKFYPCTHPVDLMLEIAAEGMKKIKVPAGEV